jgi:hypothetical protein
MLLLLAWGCKGEVPVAVDDPDEGPEEPAENVSAKDAGFVPLGFSDFTPFVSKPDEGQPTWSVSEDGLIRTTGTPRGYLYTNKTYKNFTFQGEFRFVPRTDGTEPEKYNTGFLIYVPDEHKIWPRSLEVQGRYDLMGEVKSNARDVKINTILNEQAVREAVRNRIGEWNAVEIISREGAVTSFLNGSKISECEPGELQSGHIGLQAEDFAVEFRNLRILEE